MKGWMYAACSGRVRHLIAGTKFLHATTFSRGKGKFQPVEHIPPDELPDAEYPMVLSTGRRRYHMYRDHDPAYGRPGVFCERVP